MAAEPKRSFKRTVASTVEGRSPRFLLSSLALAMVISILAGFGIGYAIGDHNKSTAKAKAVKQTPTTRRAKTASTSLKVPLKGTVVRETAKSLVVSTGKRRVALTLIPKSIIEVAQTATTAEIKPGSHVLFVLEKRSAGTTTTGGTAIEVKATEIIVVSGTAKGRLGQTVSAVTSDSMTFKAYGKTVTVSTAGAKVTTTVPAKRSRLTAGAHVLVRRFLAPAPKKKSKKARVKRHVIAVEILLVPATSAFA
jgi:RNase P/RNase MRP subunit p29